MKLKTCIILIVLCLLLLQCFSQRGGGSRSRSSSRSRSYGGSSRSTSRSTSSSAQSKSEQLVYILSVGGVFLLICIFGNKKGNGNTKPSEARMNSVRKITDEFESKYQANCCTLTEDERCNMINWFMSSSWKVEFIQQGGYEGLYSLKMKDITKRTDFVYQIQAIGQRDIFGTSIIKGILLFQNNYLSICFDKLYDDREKAGQTGKWDILIYEGIQQGEMFSGSWYYEGFKQDPAYSGEMRIIQN